jgi:hypothetical protein
MYNSQIKSILPFDRHCSASGFSGNPFGLSGRSIYSLIYPEVYRMYRGWVESTGTASTGFAFFINSS